ncbi:hypothetical protein [Longimicrobium terrae]|uniref:Secreted protein n=1 Tax=Longimicrobium terrae TaxID=1639882 RepID=A0A841GZ04_9BACT|nr:hypothetical protein [Longimicrobium terrae]MBB4636484.1 hypothetical protein [Longimicrobium terrae]MBB6070992.1 hypothetical protein [Longimicrobium terrae]NNC29014.1 hypothetical protein [Longimicrobium terrae]
MIRHNRTVRAAQAVILGSILLQACSDTPTTADGAGRSSAVPRATASSLQSGVDLSVTYPGGTPTLDWTTVYSGDHDVYILREEQIQNPAGDSYSESLQYLGTTSATTFADLTESYTQDTAWTCVTSDGDGGTLTVRKFYVVVPAAAPADVSNRAMSKTIDIGGSCYS